MKKNSITVNQSITFEVKESREKLTKIAKKLDKLMHLQQRIRKIRSHEYDIDVFTTIKITTLNLKIVTEANLPAIILTIPFKKWTSNEIRAIQRCLYERFGNTIADKFIQRSSTKNVSIKGQLITSSHFIKMFVMADSKSKVIHADNFVRLDNQYFTKEITCENYALPTNKNLRLWSFEILNQPKQHNIQITQKRSKVVHEKITLVFECDHTKINNRSKDNMPPGIRVNLPLHTPFSWISFIKLMPSYPNIKRTAILMK